MGVMDKRCCSHRWLVARVPKVLLSVVFADSTLGICVVDGAAVVVDCTLRMVGVSAGMDHGSILVAIFSCVSLTS